MLTPQGAVPMTPEERQRISQVNLEMSQRGLRVLAFAYRELPKGHVHQKSTGLYRDYPNGQKMKFHNYAHLLLKCQEYIIALNEQPLQKILLQISMLWK